MPADVLGDDDACANLLTPGTLLAVSETAKNGKLVNDALSNSPAAVASAVQVAPFGHVREPELAVLPLRLSAGVPLKLSSAAPMPQVELIELG